MSSPWFWILLVLSVMGTALCWVRILRSDDVAFFKVAGLIISAIPFIGPFVFLFLDMPPRIPEDAQAKRHWRLGTTLYTDVTRVSYSRGIAVTYALNLRNVVMRPMATNSALLTDAYTSPLRTRRCAAKRER